MEKDEEVTIYQFGIDAESAVTYRVVRDFYLETTYGPLTVVKKNTLVRLSPRMADELFGANKIEPERVGTTFQVIRAFRTTAKDGTWVNVAVGDLISMERAEAVQALRSKTVKEVIE